MQREASPSLRLLVFTHGDYGERILENISLRAPGTWIIGQAELPGSLPSIVEEPGELVMRLELGGDWDLVIFLGQSPSAFTLLPEIMSRLSAGAVIAPVDDYTWLPLGLERQIRPELEKLGVRAVFPRTFCTLAPVGIAPIDEFAELFGSPILEVEESGGVIESVRVRRGAPCGSTWFMAERLPGTMAEEAPAKAATFVQIYPCLASRSVERLLGDAPIHIAAHMAGKAVERALKREEF
jgi:hypothetical protein